MTDEVRGKENDEAGIVCRGRDYEGSTAEHTEESAHHLFIYLAHLL